MKKKTTIHDIANELSITASTVSRALRNHPRISDSTKEAVWSMAKKLNYHPNSIAAALRKGKSNIIGMMVPTADRTFFASVIKGVEEVANQAGYRVVICQSNDSFSKEQSNINALLETQVAGILASVAKETTDISHYEMIKKRGIPLILFDRIKEGLDVSAVVIDDYNGASKAVEHLIRQGCRKIAHFSGQQHISIYKERFRGYKKALMDNDIPFDEELIFESNLQLKDGRRLTEKLLSMSKPPDAIFSASDYSAMGAMQVLKENSIAIPDRVAIVGFSNESFTSFVEPSLSTVDQYSIRMGKFAAELFLEQAQATATESPFEPRKVVLNPELIIRESSLRKT